MLYGDFPTSPQSKLLAKLELRWSGEEYLWLFGQKLDAKMGALP